MYQVGINKGIIMGLFGRFGGTCCLHPQHELDLGAGYAIFAQSEHTIMQTISVVTTIKVDNIY